LQFKFDRVIAVSTTGFAVGAIEFATSVGIALHEMSQLDRVAPDLTSWLGTTVLFSNEVRQTLNDARLHIGEYETAERTAAVTAFATSRKLDEPLLRATKTGDTISAVDAFHIAAQQLPNLYEGVLPNQAPKHVTFTANYRDDQDHYLVDTNAGSVRITSIDFQGELPIDQTDVPLCKRLVNRSS
jgi:hypothetical protein